MNPVIQIREVMKLRFICLMILIIIGVVACTTWGVCTDHPGKDAYNDLKIAWRTDSVNLDKALIRSDVDSKIDVYLYAMCCVHPSDTQPIDWLQNDGCNAVRQIGDRIISTDSITLKSYLLRAMVSVDEKLNCSIEVKPLLPNIRASIGAIPREQHDASRIAFEACKSDVERLDAKYFD